MAKRTRPVDGVQRRYTWRLYPTPEQTDALLEQAAMCADLWNALLEICEQRYRSAIARDGKSVTFHCADCAAASEAKGKLVLCEGHSHPSEFTIGYWISELRAECPEWRELSTWTPRRVATSFSAAWQAFFGRVKRGEEPGYPRYKSRRRHLAVPHRCLSGCAISHSQEAWAHNRHRGNWSVWLRGVPGVIRARREMDYTADGECRPIIVNEWMDADIRFAGITTLACTACAEASRVQRRLACCPGHKLTSEMGRWEFSVATAVQPWPRDRAAGRPVPTTIRFDLIDDLALVNGAADTPDEIRRAQVLDGKRSTMQSDLDRRWPRGHRLDDLERTAWAEARADLARLAARIARIRNTALHAWSRRIVSRASAIIIIAPPSIRELTMRGESCREPTPAEIAAVNRRVLSYAPATAIAMLRYKAAEAGIGCEMVEDAAPPPAAARTNPARLTIASGGAASKSPTPLAAKTAAKATV